MPPFSTIARFSAFLLLSLFGLAACSGPGAAPADEPPAPTGPAYEVVYFGEDGLQQLDARTESVTSLVPGSTPLDMQQPSPDGSLVAVAYAVGDSSQLAVVDLESGVAQPVHEVGGEVVYTVAWAPGGDELAFGFYEPRSDGGTGAGDLLIAAADGSTTRRVGCSASRIVERWRPDGSLIVGDGANLYVVDGSTCATLHTIPLRKRHFPAISPDGEWVAFIFRDLVYNREDRAYEPDSSLYLVDYRNQNEEKIAGDRYMPHNLAWSPDGTRLAFDVQSPDDERIRHVAFYTLETGESTFLVRPEDGILSETRPVWSPDGEHLAFDRVVPETGEAQKAVRTFADMSLRVVTRAASLAELPEIWGWVGDQALVLVSDDGQKNIVPMSGISVLTLGPEQTPVSVQAN